MSKYLRTMHANLGPQILPDDIYIANLVGALNQINGGANKLLPGQPSMEPVQSGSITKLVHLPPGNLLTCQ